MTKTSSTILLVAGLAVFGASGASAQTAAYPKLSVDLDVAQRDPSETIVTSSTFSLYGEPGATSSTSRVDRGLVYGGGAAYFLRRNLSVGLVVTGFSHSTTGTVFVTTPDPLAFNAFTTVTASPQLVQTEVGEHFEAAYFLRFRNKFEVGMAGGPSVMQLSREIASASVVNGEGQIAVAEQKATAWGGHGSLAINYLATSRVGGGVFARYVAAKADLPAAAGIKLGRFQVGFGLHFRF